MCVLADYTPTLDSYPGSGGDYYTPTLDSYPSGVGQLYPNSGLYPLVLVVPNPNNHPSHLQSNPYTPTHHFSTDNFFFIIIFFFVLLPPS